jgi:hypothetical protein
VRTHVKGQIVCVARLARLFVLDVARVFMCWKAARVCMFVTPFAYIRVGRCALMYVCAHRALIYVCAHRTRMYELDAARE